MTHRFRTARAVGVAALAAGLTLAGTVRSLAQSTGPVLDIRLVLVADGTAPFEAGAPMPDEAGGAGLDADGANGVVRTFDDVMLQLQWSVNDADATNVRLTSALPAGMSWVSLPTACRTTGVTPPSSFTGGTLVCNVGDRHQGENGVVDTIARVGALGNAQPLTITAGVTADSGTPVVTSPIELLTSAAPKLNIVSQHLVGGNPEQSVGALRSVELPGGVRGRAFLYPVTVEVGGSGKGSEPPAAGDLTFTLDYSALPPSAHAIPAASLTAQFAGVQTCGATNWISPGTPYGRVGVTPNASAPNSAADSGTWTCTDDPATRTVSVTVTGANLTPASSPSKDALGQPLRAGRSVIVSGTVAIAVTDAELSAISGIPGIATLPPIRIAWQSEPLGASGAPNTGEDPSDNTAVVSYRYDPTGGFTSEYRNTPASVTADTGGGTFVYLQPQTSFTAIPDYKAYIPTQTQDHNIGDGRVTPGQRYGYLVADGNFSTDPANVAACVNIGPGQSLAPIDPYPIYDFAPVGNLDALFTGAAPVRTTAGPDRGVGAPAMVNSVSWVNEVPPWLVIWGPSDAQDHVTIEYSTDPATYALDCNDAFTWFAAPPADLSSVTRVRFRSTQPVLPGEFLQFYVSLTANAGVPGTPLWTTASLLEWPAADPFPAGATGWQGTAPYDPAQWCNPPSTRPHPSHNDCVTLSGAQLGLTKRVVGPTTDLKGGDRVTYELHATVSGDAGAVADNVIVTDTLPAGLSFTGTATPAATNGATAGGTTLGWDLGSLPVGSDVTVTYEVVVAHGLGAYTVLPNAAHITGDITAGATVTPLVPVNAVAYVQTGGTYAQFEILKTIAAGMIDQNGPLHFDLVATNTGTTQLGDASLIDVLPFNGDGRTPPTAFHGTLALTGVTLPPGAAVRYTLAEPGMIVIDPQHPSNLPGGTTLWCESTDTDPAIPDLGASGCPAGVGDATAIRIDRPGPLDPGATVTVGVDLLTDGNSPADRYTNRFGGRIGGITLPVRSNQVSAVVRGVDVSLTKAVADPGPFTFGDSVTFSLALSNSGPDAATNIAVTDRLPAGLQFASADGGGSFAGGATGGSGGIVRWNVPSLAAGASITLHMTARIVDLDSAALTNLAEVTAQDQPDADSAPSENPLDATHAPDEDDEAAATVGISAVTTTVVATTVPEPTVPTTVPETTVPATTVPATTVPEPATTTTTLHANAPTVPEAPAPAIVQSSETTTTSTTPSASAAPTLNGANPLPTAPPTTKVPITVAPVPVAPPALALSGAGGRTAEVKSGTELAFTGAPTRAAASVALLLIGIGLLLVDRRRQPGFTTT